MSSLIVERAVTSPVERVWIAFTTDALATWFWPPLWDTSVQLDVQVGGRYRVASAVSDMAVSGEYLAIDPGRALVQSWQWDGDDEVTTVTIALRPTDAGTSLTITQEGFARDDVRDNHIQGWNDCLARLPEVLA